MGFLNNKWLNRVIRIVVGGVFIYSSIDKLQHPMEFAKIVARYGLLPDSISGLVAAVLPFMELVLGLLLVFDVWTMPSLLWIGTLLGVFIVAITQALARGLKIDCGCFTTISGDSQITFFTVARDVSILFLWLKAFHYYGFVRRVNKEEVKA